MKYLLITLFLFFLNSDKKVEFNYNLLIGSWSQRSIANTTSTGVFTFKKDSTAGLEMRNGKTDAMIGGMTGPYSLKRSKGILKMSLMGKEKEFEIQELTSDVLVIQNKKEGKEKQVFNRLIEK